MSFVIISETVATLKLAENHHPASDRPPKWLGRAAAALFLAAAVVGAYWKLVATGEYSWLESPDLANQVLPWLQMQASEWHAGRFPLWDPYHWAGQPLMGQLLPGAACPLNWILFALPLNNGWIQQVYLHWYLVLLHVIAAWGAYRLARELRCSRGASCLAGLSFSLTGWMSTFDWPQLVNGAIWAPLVLRFLLRVWRGHRTVSSSVYAGFFLGLTWLSGHHQFSIFLTLLAGAVWAAGVARQPHQWRRLAASLLLFGVVMVSTGALQILPAREYARHAVRWVGLQDPIGWDQKVPYLIHTRYSLQPVSLLGIVFPDTWDNANPFLGVTVLTLALLAIFMTWERIEVRWLAAIAAATLLVSLGAASVLHGWLYSLAPFFDKARNPSFAVLLFGLCCAALAAIGADRAIRSLGHPVLRRAVWILLGFAGLVLLFRTVMLLAQPVAPNSDSRGVLTAFTALLLAGLLHWLRRGTLTPRGAIAGLLLLLFFEAGLTLGQGWKSRFDTTRASLLEPMAQYGDIVEFLRRQPEPFRIDVDDAVIPYNFGDWQGIPELGGYLASVTTNINVVEAHSPAMRRILGVRYALRRTPDSIYTEDVFTGSSGLKVFRDPHAYPRAYAVHKAEIVPNRKTAPVWLQEPQRDWRRSVFLPVVPPTLEQCEASEQVRIVEYAPDRVRLQASLGCRGMVILGDTFYPGWDATVDGRTAGIYEAYTAVRGVVVDGGSHTIEFRFRPRSVRLGAVLTALAFLSTLTLWAIESRRRS